MLHDLIHRNTVSQPVDPLKFSLLAQRIFLDEQWKKGLQGEHESKNKHDH